MLKSLVAFRSQFPMREGAPFVAIDSKGLYQAIAGTLIGTLIVDFIIAQFVGGQSGSDTEANIKLYALLAEVAVFTAVISALLAMLWRNVAISGWVLLIVVLVFLVDWLKAGPNTVSEKPLTGIYALRHFLGYVHAILFASQAIMIVPGIRRWAA